MRGPRLQVGSAAWVAEERSSALQIIDTEVEEFSYSARNEVDWLNEHMAGIFDENETYVLCAYKILIMDWVTDRHQKFCRDLQNSRKAAWQDPSHSTQARGGRGSRSRCSFMRNF